MEENSQEEKEKLLFFARRHLSGRTNFSILSTRTIPDLVTFVSLNLLDCLSPLKTSFPQTHHALACSSSKKEKVKKETGTAQNKTELRRQIKIDS